MSTQAILAAWRTNQLLQEARERGSVGDTEHATVVLAFDEPIFSKPYRDVFQSELVRASDIPLDLRSVLARSDDPNTPRYEEFAPDIAAYQPVVIVAVMDETFPTILLPQIEDDWPDAVVRPYYVLSSLNANLDQLDQGPIGTNLGLRSRVGGTDWLPSAPVLRNRSLLGEEYDLRPGAERAYDAAFVAVYSLLLADLDNEMQNRSAVVAALDRLQAGLSVNVGPGPLQFVLEGQDVRGGIDLVGASSDLNWDEDRRPSMDVGLWCLVEDEDGQIVIKEDTGPRWHVDTGEIDGTYACDGNP